MAFLGTGFVFASWESRLPQIRSELQLSASDPGVRAAGAGRRVADGERLSVTSADWVVTHRGTAPPPSRGLP